MTEMNPLSTEEVPAEETRQNQNAFLVAAIIFGAALVATGIYLFMAWQQGVWQVYTLAGVMATLCAVVFAAMRAIRGGRPETGGWMAIIGTYLAQLTMVTSVRIIGGGQVALLNPLETFLTVIWSVLFLSESLTAIQWVGGGLILLSALLAIQRLRRARTINIGGD